MKNGNMTREQVISELGDDIIDKLDRTNCEPTNRVGYNGNCQGDAEVEMVASIRLENGEHLSAYYYVDADEYDQTEDMSNIDWVKCLEGYEIK